MSKESNMKNMLLCLFVVTFVASALLGGVYVLTYEPIQATIKNEINVAIGQVVPEFDNSPVDEAITIQVEGKTATIYPAILSDVPVGYAVKASTSKGFGGPIELMVGFLPDGTIYGTAVISHTETPGLGDKIDKKKSEWSVQFDGQNPANFKLAVKKDGGQVDAITASTISSRAFCDAVALAYKAFITNIKEEGGQNE
ncbi:MAG: RnfABCDGE type electron transport complex subunit G [Prevotellaceae bacterium]|jgi:electron transport complex protein RnfG|nr:RnfABCDGE type electron transport complex subunit G [Prevotellaceae bacterium]